MILAPSQDKADWYKISSSTQKGMQFKIPKFFIFGIFHPVFLDCGWPQVMETLDYHIFLFRQKRAEGKGTISSTRKDSEWIRNDMESETKEFGKLNFAYIFLTEKKTQVLWLSVLI